MISCKSLLALGRSTYTKTRPRISPENLGRDLDRDLGRDLDRDLDREYQHINTSENTITGEAD